MGEVLRSLPASKAPLPRPLSWRLPSCGQPPIKPAATHVRVEGTARPEGAIPAPVQIVPLAAAADAGARPETYSVVVNNVRVQDLLFALARDAKLNVDIHPGVTGVGDAQRHRPDPAATARPDRQSGGHALRNRRPEADRDARHAVSAHLSRSTTSTCIRESRASRPRPRRSAAPSGGAGTGGGGIGAAGNKSTSTVTTSVRTFWKSWWERQGSAARDRQDQARQAGRSPQGQRPRRPRRPRRAGSGGSRAAAAATSSFREAASVIANRGNRRADHSRDVAPAREGPGVSRPGHGQRQAPGADRGHDRRGAAEQQLPARHRLDALIPGAFGLGFSQKSPTGGPAPAVTTSQDLSFAILGRNIIGTLKLLESFGNVRVLSSPKFGVVNNQTASLKVVNNRFTSR